MYETVICIVCQYATNFLYFSGPIGEFFRTSFSWTWNTCIIVAYSKAGAYRLSVWDGVGWGGGVRC
jgi:poly(A) polymerase Pap1